MTILREVDILVNISIGIQIVLLRGLFSVIGLRIEISSSILELMIIAQNNILRILKRSMIDQGHLRNGEIEMQRETTS